MVKNKKRARNHSNIGRKKKRQVLRRASSLSSSAAAGVRIMVVPMTTTDQTTWDDVKVHNLLNFLYQKLIDFGLLLNDDRSGGFETFIISYYHQTHKKNKCQIEVSSPRQAELLCYLNGITYKRKKESMIIQLSRMTDWAGRKPYYKNFIDFQNILYMYDYPPGFGCIEEVFTYILDRFALFPSSGNDVTSSTIYEIDNITGYYRIKSPVIEALFTDWKKRADISKDKILSRVNFGRNPYGTEDYAMTNIVVEGPSFDPKTFKESVPSFFNEMMKMHNLVDDGDVETIISRVWIYKEEEKGKEEVDSSRSSSSSSPILMLRLVTPELADRIMLLNGIESDDGTHIIRLKRHPEYQDPKEKKKQKKPVHSEGEDVHDHRHLANELRTETFSTTDSPEDELSSQQDTIQQGTLTDPQLVVEDNALTVGMDSSFQVCSVTTGGGEIGDVVPDHSTLKFCTTCMKAVHRNQWDIQTWPLLYGICNKCKSIE